MGQWDKLNREAGLETQGLLGLVGDILDRARINADDTVYVEKSAEPDQWDQIAMGTLEMILTYSDADLLNGYENVSADEARDWFASRGVKF